MTFILVRRFFLRRDDKTFTTQSKECFRLEVLSDGNELPTNVRAALRAYSDLPSIAGEPREVCWGSVDHAHRFFHSFIYSQRFVDVSRGITIVRVNISFGHRENIWVAGNASLTTFAVKVTHLKEHHRNKSLKKSIETVHVFNLHSSAIVQSKAFAYWRNCWWKS